MSLVRTFHRDWEFPESLLQMEMLDDVNGWVCVWHNILSYFLCRDPWLKLAWYLVAK